MDGSFLKHEPAHEAPLSRRSLRWRHQPPRGEQRSVGPRRWCARSALPRNGGRGEIRKNNNPLPQMILRQGVIVWNQYRYYIIPPSGIAGAGVGSGMSTIPHSVVRNIPATEAAFSRATRLTLVGSMTPASNILTYSSVRAL